MEVEEDVVPVDESDDRQIKLKIHLSPGAKIPKRTSSQAAGWDVFSCLPPDTQINLPPGERILIPTGISLEIPVGYLISLRPRSGLAYQQGFFLVNAPATIDSDYRGEIKVIAGNIDQRETIIIRHHQRIAQILLEKVYPIDWEKVESREDLSFTQRGTDSFGSSGLA